MQVKTLRGLMMVFALTVVSTIPNMAHAQVGQDESKQIAEEAFIYGLPLVMNYAVFYQ